MHELNNLFVPVTSRNILNQSRFNRIVRHNTTITLKMISPDIPQQNGVAERSFTVIRQKAISMMEMAKFTPKIKSLLWAEAMATATLLTNITISSTNIGNKSSYEVLHGSKPSIVKHLKTFGTVAYVSIRAMKSKLDRRSKRCIMVGYAENHAEDCYRLYNPVTRKIILSRDVTWNGSIPIQTREYETGIRSESEEDEIVSEQLVTTCVREEKSTLEYLETLPDESHSIA